LIIERTFDLDVINAVLKHSSVECKIGDDQSQGTEYPLHENIYYLSVWGEFLAGMFVVFPLNGVTCDAHSAILPSYYGKKAIIAGKLAIDWVFENTHFLKITGKTPTSNPLAVKYSKAIGFRTEGLSKASYMKNGKLIDQVYFGLEREAWALKRH